MSIAVTSNGFFLPPREVLEESGYTVVDKLWGYEVWLVNNTLYCGKALVVRPGFCSSIHYHPVKHETFVAVEGVVKVALWIGPAAMWGDVEVEVLRGWAKDKVEIPPYTPHCFEAMEGREAVVLEFSTPHSDEDVVRIVGSRALRVEGYGAK